MVINKRPRKSSLILTAEEAALRRRYRAHIVEYPAVNTPPSATSERFDLSAAVKSTACAGDIYKTRKALREGRTIPSPSNPHSHFHSHCHCFKDRGSKTLTSLDRHICSLILFLSDPGTSWIQMEIPNITKM